MALYSTLQKFITKEGTPVEGASVNVKLSGGAVDAELFATRTGTAKGNPFLTTANGEALCYVEAGRYDMTVTKGTDQIVFKGVEVGPVSNVGTFAEGGSITDPDQLVEDADGNKWRWTGNLNYTFAAGENPESNPEWVKYIGGKYASIIALLEQWGYRYKGTFAKGFTYSQEKDAGIDENGSSWIYTGAGAPNKVVAAGTVPSVGAGYEQVVFNAVSGVFKVDGVSDLLSFPERDLVDNYNYITPSGGCLVYSSVTGKFTATRMLSISDFGAIRGGDCYQAFLDSILFFMGADTLDLYIDGSYHISNTVEMPTGMGLRLFKRELVRDSQISTSGTLESMFVYRGGSIHLDGVEFLGSSYGGSVSNSSNSSSVIKFDGLNSSTESAEYITIKNCSFIKCYDGLNCEGKLPFDVTSIIIEKNIFKGCVRTGAYIIFDSEHGCKSALISKNTYTDSIRTGVGFGFMQPFVVLSGANKTADIGRVEDNRIENITNETDGAIFCTMLHGFDSMYFYRNHYENIKSTSIKTNPPSECRVIEARTGYAVVENNVVVDVSPKGGQGAVSLTGGGRAAGNIFENKTINLNKTEMVGVYRGGYMLRFRGSAVAVNNEIIGYTAGMLVQPRGLLGRKDVLVSGNVFRSTSMSLSNANRGTDDVAVTIAPYTDANSSDVNILIDDNLMIGLNSTIGAPAIRTRDKNNPYSISISSLVISNNIVRKGYGIFSLLSSEDGKIAYTGDILFSGNIVEGSERLMSIGEDPGVTTIFSDNHMSNSLDGLYRSRFPSFLVKDNNSKEGKLFKNFGSGVIADGSSEVIIDIDMPHRPQFVSATGSEQAAEAVSAQIYGDSLLRVRRAGTSGELNFFWYATTKGRGA